MTDQPQTIVQAGGKVAEDIVGGLKSAPTLLLIVILNITMILVGGWYLARQEDNRSLVVKELIGLMRSCILETAPMHGVPPGRRDDRMNFKITDRLEEAKP